MEVAASGDYEAQWLEQWVHRWKEVTRPSFWVTDCEDELWWWQGWVGCQSWGCWWLWGTMARVVGSLVKGGHKTFVLGCRLWGWVVVVTRLSRLPILRMFCRWCLLTAMCGGVVGLTWQRLLADYFLKNFSFWPRDVCFGFVMVVRWGFTTIGFDNLWTVGGLSCSGFAECRDWVKTWGSEFALIPSWCRTKRIRTIEQTLGITT